MKSLVAVGFDTMMDLEKQVAKGVNLEAKTVVYIPGQLAEVKFGD